jgi:hypothetical protein
MDTEFEAVATLVDTLVEFAVACGFQILGALVFLIVGLKIASWTMRRSRRLGFTISPTVGSRLASDIRCQAQAILRHGIG